MLQMRIIRIITPFNEVINIEIGGHESELRELLSVITGIQPQDIKGIKDKYGNYHTLSSAINNPNINSNFSETYQLICHNSFQDVYSYEEPQEIDPYNSNKRYERIMSPSLSSHANSYYNNYGYNQEANKNLRNVFNFNQNQDSYPVSYTENNISNIPRGRSRGRMSSEKGYPNNFNKKNLINNNQYNHNHNSHRTNYSSTNLIPVNLNNYNQQPQTNNNGLVDRCLQIAKELNEKFLINDRNLSRLKSLILYDNEETINLFKVYIQDVIEKRVFVTALNRLLNNLTDKTRPASPQLIKSKLLKLIAELDNSFFDANDDGKILRHLAEGDNQAVIQAFELYTQDDDFESFLETIKLAIAKFKRQTLNYTNKSNSIQSSKEDEFNYNQMANLTNLAGIVNIKPTIEHFPENNAKTIQNISQLNTNPQNNEIKIQDDFNEYRKQSIVDNSSFRAKTPQKPAVLDKETEKAILSNMHTEQKIIFKYALKKRLPEIDVLINYYNTIENEDYLLKSVKIFCKKFINENIIKNLSESSKNIFNEQLTARNQKLITIFKDFNEHYSVSRLQTEVETYMNNLKNKSNEGDKIKPPRNASEVSSQSNSEDEIDQSINNSKQKEKENSSFRHQTSINHAKQIEFMKLVKYANFLMPEQKKSLERMMERQDNQIVSIIDEYYKTKSIAHIKPTILKLLKNKPKDKTLEAEIITQSNIAAKAKPNLAKRGSNESAQSFNNISTNNEPRPSISKRESSKTKDQKSILHKLRTGDQVVSPESRNISVKESPKQINNNSLILAGRDSIPPIYKSLENLLSDLSEKNKISKSEHQYLIQRYNMRDDMILSAWEVYTLYHNLPDLVESLRIFYNKNRKANPANNINMNKQTPLLFRDKKHEIIDFLKDKDKEKEEIKKKQFHIIEILAQENMLDKKSEPLINDMISSENQCVISAFEIFSVTKDHWEFCETLSLITEIYANNNNLKIKKKNNEANNAYYSESNQDSVKEAKLRKTFEAFLNSNRTFSDNEKTMLLSCFNGKDEALLSSLELYDSYRDDGDLIDTLQIILKRF